MERPTFPATSGDATAEAERAVAWLRLPAVGLIALGESIGPNEQRDWFLVVLAVFAAWSAGVLAYVHVRRAGERFAIVATAIDILAICILAVLSGGAYSHARLAFFLIPVAVAFRFRPSFTALAVVVTTAAYVLQATVHHPASSQPAVTRFIVTQAGYLAWIGVA